MSLAIPEDCIFCVMGAGAIIEKEDNGKKYILLQRRIDHQNDYQDGIIEIPCGKVKKIYSVFDVIRRRVKAETGLTVTSIQGEQNQSYSDQYYSLREYVPFYTVQNVDNIYPVTIDFFICKVFGEPLTETKDAKDIRWYSIEDAAELLKNYENEFFPMIRSVLKKYFIINGVI